MFTNFNTKTINKVNVINKRSWVSFGVKNVSVSGVKQ